MYCRHLKEKDRIWINHHQEYNHHYATVFAIFEHDVTGVLDVELLSKTKNGLYRMRHKTSVSYHAGKQYTLTQLLFNLASDECAQLHVCVEDSIGLRMEYHWSPELKTA